MKEFSNVIFVYPIKEMGQTLSPEDNPELQPHIFHADSFYIEPQAENQDAGVIYNCDKTIIIDSPVPTELNLFKIPISSIIIFKDTDGNKYKIGSKHIPATVMIQKHLQKSKLIIQCNSISNPL